MRILVSAFLLFSFFIAAAQKEYHKWYFGDEAGIDFVPGSAVALTNGAMNSTDNPATISDSVGNLLFYSNSLQVWNKNHQVMANGTGLLGDNTAGHTATIIRKPGSHNLYYLFTLDAFAGANGLRYSVVDMNLNGGLGDIVTGQKNIVVLAPASEQVVPVVHANGKDIWIVTHAWNSSSFHAYLVTAAGISNTPVISTVGSARNGVGDNALGQITVNEANNKIAWALYGSDMFELFDFNNATGTLSGALSVTGYTNAWGVEFSPDGSKLYLTGWTTQYVYQFDLSVYTQAAISGSAVNLGNVTGPGAPYFNAYMQRAPDGKIYMAVYLDPYLAVINNPNAAGTACNLVDDGFNLGGKLSGAGLPDKVVVTYSCNVQADLGNDTTVCAGQPVVLDATQSGATYVWNNGSTAATLTPNSTGTYSVTVSDGAGCSLTDSVVVTFLPPSGFSLGADTTYCGNFTRILSTGSPSTNWSTGATGPQITITTPGIYWATDNNQCFSATDTIQISQLSAPALALPADTGFCPGDSVMLSVAGAASILWSTGATGNSIYVTTEGVYWVEGFDIPGCIVRDSVNVSAQTAPVFALGTDTSFCGSGGLALRTGIIDAQYQWQDNSTLPEFVVTQSGTYSVTVTNACGSATDEVNVNFMSNGCQLAIPTAFSPNGDGINDQFRAISFCPVGRFSMHVYNRWGELVYESDDITEGWSGVFRKHQQPLGVFVYYIEYFNDCSQQMEKQVGNVTLVR